jgi:hypothetical protein
MLPSQLETTNCLMF